MIFRVVVLSAFVFCGADAGAQSSKDMPRLNTAPSIPPSAPTTTENSSVTSVACNAACVRGNADRAVQACAPRIEAEAPGDFEWLMRPYGSIFQEANSPTSPDSPVVRYRGDSIRFLSPQKEWVRAIYECNFDTAKQQVASVVVKLGVLGKASAVPVLPQPKPQANAKQAAPAAALATTPQSPPPASDRRRVGEPDEISVFQVKPPASQR